MKWEKYVWWACWVVGLCHSWVNDSRGGCCCQKYTTTTQNSIKYKKNLERNDWHDPSFSNLLWHDPSSHPKVIADKSTRVCSFIWMKVDQAEVKVRGGVGATNRAWGLYPTRSSISSHRNTIDKVREIQSIMWEKYILYSERNTFDTVREIQLI